MQEFKNEKDLENNDRKLFEMKLLHLNAEKNLLKDVECLISTKNLYKKDPL